MYHYKYSNGARSRFVIKVVGIGGTAAEEDDSRRLGCTRAVRWRWNRRGRWRWRTRSRRRGSVGRGQGLGEGDDAVRQEVFVVTAVFIIMRNRHSRKVVAGCLVPGPQSHHVRKGSRSGGCDAVLFSLLSVWKVFVSLECLATATVLNPLLNLLPWLFPFLATYFMKSAQLQVLSRRRKRKRPKKVPKSSSSCIASLRQRATMLNF